MTDQKNGFTSQEGIEENTEITEGMPLISIPGTPRSLNIDKEIAQIEKDIQFFNKIKTTSLKLTKPSDWIFQQEGPYLMDRGAENIAIAFGVDISDIKLRMEWAEDDNGRYYTYVATGKAYSKRLGRYVEDIGVCSQRDKFFGKVGNEYKALEDVDMANIRRKAITNLHSRLIKRVIGLMGITEDDLKEAGIDISKIQRIEYKSGKQKSSQSLPPAALETRKKIWDMANEIAMGDEAEIKALVKKCSTFAIKDEKTGGPKDKFVEDVNDLTTEKWINMTFSNMKKEHLKAFPNESNGEQK